MIVETMYLVALFSVPFQEGISIFPCTDTMNTLLTFSGHLLMFIFLFKLGA